MTTKAVGRKRLAKLADFLETVPRKRFDMRVWAYAQEKFVFRKDKPVVTTSPECGTSACALGWATAVFPRHLMLTALPTCQCGECRDREPRRAEVVLRENPKVEGFDAAEKFFALTMPQAYELFDTPYGEKKVTPKQKARQIRRFIKSGA